MGLGEIAQFLRVSRQRADQLARTKGFPVPVEVLQTGRIWKREDVEHWAQQTGRKTK
jgi:predicted DNA-binding transcriptional regulator AlpA